MLGRKDLRTLIAWWKALREEREKENKKENEEEDVKDSGVEEEELSENEKELDDIQNMVAELEVNNKSFFT